MFHPVGRPLERGWVGRVDGDRVLQLAAQTLQSFFTGGGTARVHAEYPLSDVVLLAPVLHPPSVRLFDDQSTFAFANPAAVIGTSAEIACSAQSQTLVLASRIAGLVGAEGRLVAMTILAEWRDPTRPPPKDRDFALGVGPVATTTDVFDPVTCVHVVSVDGVERHRVSAPPVFDWEAARALAAQGTKLYAGDLLAGPACGSVEVAQGSVVEIEVDGIGVLEQRLGG